MEAPIAASAQITGVSPSCKVAKQPKIQFKGLLDISNYDIGNVKLVPTVWLNTTCLIRLMNFSFSGWSLVPG